MTTSKKKFDIKQFIIAATLVMTLVLLVTGISYPNSALMSFANVGMFDTILRSLVVVGLVAILLSRPPRSTQVRCIIGLLSSVVLIGACVSMVDYRIGLIDTALYVQASIILAIEAIENQKAPVRFAQSSVTH